MAKNTTPTTSTVPPTMTFVAVDDVPAKTKRNAGSSKLDAIYKLLQENAGKTFIVDHRAKGPGYWSELRKFEGVKVASRQAVQSEQCDLPVSYTDKNGNERSYVTIYAKFEKSETV